ncbi:MAG: bifunctional UDP-N-acetylglucosamine diphosphorylase/glucosamine-1-phosphate N-acetyltransferase GlmU [Microbacteriaceae bacterium]|nr:bifunctional UDP-N-acetylglucosamine diphosphorylase/glucosamine-1-phosphate N-acetyltransferase GlmU [Microbacteriaceae bacterium]
MSERSLAVVVLAAGQGTRMRSATPKVLHRIAGRTLIGHVLTTARELAPAHVAVVVRHERDAVVAAIADAAPGLIVVDQDEIPGTGRAVELAVAALPAAFDGDVVVLSGDVPLLDPATLSVLLDRHRSAGAAATLLTAALADATGYGRILRGADGLVDRIVEHADASEEQRLIGEVNSGTYVFAAAALRAALPRIGAQNAQGEKYLTDAIGILRGDGLSVAATLADDATSLAGVNDRAQLAEAERVLNARIVRAHQLAGVTIRDPHTTWIDVDVTIGRDAEILPGTQLRGATTIGENAIVGPDTTLTDTEVGDLATVSRSDATLAVIGTAATVGPFAYLRPGTVLGAAGKIGTFVETKNTVIGKGSKVPHLSYVGDAEIGEGSNLGASTITANYDGVRKHRTRIGSRVHTGVHNSLVAPVEIGDDATLGAGAVIRKDVPPGALAVSVAPQRNREGWAAEQAAASGLAAPGSEDAAPGGE